MRTIHTLENGRPTVVTRAGQQWRSHWHRFVDCLADGKTAADFFQSLPEKENPCVSEYSHRCLSGRIGRIGCMDGEAYLQVLTNICHCRSRSWHSKKGKHSVVYLQRAGNSVACKTGIMPPFHHHERGQRDGIPPLFLPARC